MFIRTATWSDPDTWAVREVDDTVIDALFDTWAAAWNTPDAPAPLAAGGAAAYELDVATADCTALSAGELVDAVTGFERVIAWATARQHEMIAEFHARPGDGTVRPAADVPDPAGQPAARREWAADEIGLALMLAPGAAAARMALADRLAGVLRPTRDLLAAGAICPARAKLIHDMLLEHDDEIAAAVQERVLPRAPQQTKGQLQAALTRAITAVLPDPEQRHQKAEQARRVELYPALDGMATLSAFLTATEATASYEWITRLARGVADVDGDGTEHGRGSMDRRRADVLAALLTGRLVASTGTGSTGAAPASTAGQSTVGQSTCGDSTAASTIDDSTADSWPTATGATPAGPTAAGATPAGPAGAATTPTNCSTDRRACVLAAPVSAHRPLIHITMPISTLLGLDDEPAELAGYGPLPAPIARDIAADPDSVWRRLLTDPISGQLLDYGRTTYRPPAGLAGFVRARDGSCRYPGCRRAAIACELDHVQPWQPHGHTAENNLCALCAKHHDLKEQPGWQVVLHDDRRLEWTTPTGHRYCSRPVEHPTPPAAPPPARRTTEELFTLDPPHPDDPPPF